MWQKYRKTAIQEMRDYVPGEDLNGVSVAPGETPKEGGKIARDRQGSRWYVSPEFMAENYEQICERVAPRYPWHHIEDDYMPPHKSGADIISAERKRQIEVEGWSAEDDDQKHPQCQLAMAAVSYIMFATEIDISRNYQRNNGHIPAGWPWNSSWWKPSSDNSPADRIRELAKAGALIAAEIDRLQLSVDDYFHGVPRCAMDQIL